MKPVSAVIFDLDGVIVDSESRHVRAFVELFDEMGYGDRHGMDFTAYYGRSDRVFWLDFIALHHPKQPIEELLNLKQTRYLEIIRQDKPIFEAIPALLQKLAARYPLAVASGSSHPVIDEVLAMQSLRRFFTAVASVQDVPRGKPAPDVFLHAAKLLQVAPAECCVVEDAAVGVEAALAAGMRVIAITNTLPAEKLSRATHVVARYEQIERLLLPRKPATIEPGVRGASPSLRGSKEQGEVALPGMSR